MDNLVQRLRKYAEWHTKVTNAEQRAPFGESSLNVEEHISWKAADRIESLERRVLEQYRELGALSNYAELEKRIEVLEAALREIITNSGTGWDKLHPIDIARRALEPKSE